MFPQKSGGEGSSWVTFAVFGSVDTVAEHCPEMAPSPLRSVIRGDVEADVVSHLGGRHHGEIRREHDPLLGKAPAGPGSGVAIAPRG